MSESAPINIGGFGGIDMWPDRTADAAKIVSGAGQIFGTAWAGLSASILAAEKEVGQGLDEMSMAFSASYNAYAKAVEPAAAAVQGTYEGLGNGGAKAVALYRQADQNASARFRSSG